MGNVEVLKSAPLFSGIEDKDFYLLLNCLTAIEKSFEKNDYIYIEGDHISAVGIVIDGGLQIVSEDAMGNRGILSEVGVGDVFGEAFACAGTRTIPVSVVSRKKSRVLFIDYEKIISTCPHSCPFHKTLISNMLMILANKNIGLNQKIDCLSKRSMREKITAFLNYYAGSQERFLFEIPFNRQEMADYLCVDRSALSAELGRMRDEGIIEFKKNTFAFLSE